MNFKFNKYYLILILFFLVILIFRFNNVLNYNSYWGYDGAKHMEYIDSIEDKYRLPTFTENYLAWHEPLYYFIFAIFGFIYKFITSSNNFILMIKFLQILTAFLDVIFLFIFYKTLSLLTDNKSVKLITLLTIGFFTPLILINNYLTNELFLYWLIILCFYFIVKFDKTGWNYQKIILVSILSGLTLLTKLSAIIFIVAFIIWFLYQTIYYKKHPNTDVISAEAGIQETEFAKKTFFRDTKHTSKHVANHRFLFVFLAIVFVINLPWQIYRAKNLGGVLTINNYELLQEQKISQIKDISNKFWFNFDNQIFNNPFWATGKKSFWSITFAQTFVDYDNIGGNVDFNNAQKQVKTGNGRYLSTKTFNWAKIALKNGFLMLLIMLIGYFVEIKALIKNKLKPDINLLFNLFIIGSFFALIFNVLKNPFIERGTLKLIFIISAFPWLFFLSYKNLNVFLQNKKLKLIWLFILVVVIFYSFLSLKINWVVNY